VETREPRVPSAADVRHPVERTRERLRRQLVPCLAPFASALDEACLAQRGEVLRDRLARDVELGGELGRRRRAAVGERFDDVAPIRISERVEYAPGRVGHA
jgi:hypothetical protein